MDLAYLGFFLIWKAAAVAPFDAYPHSKEDCMMIDQPLVV
jgi:hypothetical protein